MAKETKPSTKKKGDWERRVVPHTSIRRDGQDVTVFLQKQPTYPVGYLASLDPVATPRTTWYLKLAYAWLMVVRGFVWLVCAPKAWAASRRRTTEAGRPSLGGKPSEGEASLARRLMLFSSDAQATAMSGMIMNHYRVFVTGRPDRGWIHALAMEVECGRTQWLIWQEAFASGVLNRIIDLVVLFNLLSQCCLVYLFAPSVVHAYQVLRAEEVMWWQSRVLEMLDTPGALPLWENSPAPLSARQYYRLEEGASFRDALLRMRADEASIRRINLRLMELRPGDSTSVFAGIEAEE